jgi:hypothetical protein
MNFLQFFCEKHLTNCAIYSTINHQRGEGNGEEGRKKTGSRLPEINAREPEKRIEQLAGGFGGSGDNQKRDDPPC